MDPTAAPQESVFEKVTRVLLGSILLRGPGAPQRQELVIPKEHQTPQMELICKGLLDKIDALEFELSHDPNTGLPNSRAFMAKLENLLAERKKSVAARQTDDILLYADINHFKQFNTIFSEQRATDYLVKSIAGVLGKKVEEMTAHRRISMGSSNAAPDKTWDYLARRRGKGDEFFILMHNCEKDIANDYFKNIRNEIAQITFIVPSQKKAISNISIAHGAYRLDSKSNNTADETDAEFTVTQVEKKMYKKKEDMQNPEDGKKGKLPDPTNPKIVSITAEELRDYRHRAKEDPTIVIVDEKSLAKAAVAV